MSRQPTRSLRTPVAKPAKAEKYRSPYHKDAIVLQRITDRRAAHQADKAEEKAKRKDAKTAPNSHTPLRLPGWALSNIEKAKTPGSRKRHESQVDSRSAFTKPK